MRESAGPLALERMVHGRGGKVMPSSSSRWMLAPREGMATGNAAAADPLVMGARGERVLLEEMAREGARS